MNIKYKSYFKSPESDIAWFNQWVVELEHSNGRNYDRISLDTSLGKTHVWGLNTEEASGW